jgi:protein involved in polysaccharide export with SLBB domain
MKKLIVILLLASLARAEEFVLLYPLLIGQASDAVVETENMSESQVYRIEPGDVLEIMILGEEELSRTLMVLHNGMVSFPLIGEVKISGLTTDEAASLISTELKKYFTYPVVSVILKSPTNPQVSARSSGPAPSNISVGSGSLIISPWPVGRPLMPTFPG